MVIGAEYYEDELVQFSADDYNPAENGAIVKFEKSPAKGNILKFFYLVDLECLTPIYPHKEITVK